MKYKLFVILACSYKIALNSLILYKIIQNSLCPYVLICCIFSFATCWSYSFLIYWHSNTCMYSACDIFNTFLEYDCNVHHCIDHVLSLLIRWYILGGKKIILNDMYGLVILFMIISCEEFFRGKSERGSFIILSYLKIKIIKAFYERKKHFRNITYTFEIVLVL